MKEQIKKSEESFKILGVPVYKTYHEEINRFVDITDQFDLICMSNPYEFLTHPLYTLGNISTKNALPFYIEYTYALFKYNTNVNTKLHMQNFWRIYLNTKNGHNEMKTQSELPWSNCKFTGYTKMDSIVKRESKNIKSKQIIIALHHTILPNNDLNLGSFLEFAETYQRLPEIYPDIEFIFRPHPLLLQKIDEYKALGEISAKEYFRKLVSENKNCSFSNEADYFELFAASDAMIHDCGSFTAEYLHTGNPVCFAKSKRTDFSREMSETGMGCINQHYIAESFDDMKFFIDEIVIRGRDHLKDSREKFFRNELEAANRNPSQIIIEDIKKTLLLN